MVKKLLRYLRDRRFRYTPLAEITISKERLLHNLHTYQKMHPGQKIAPVLKSNAYGHSLTKVAKIIDKEEIPFIVVDSYHEALIMRNEGVKSPILMIGYTMVENILKAKLNNVVFTITSLDQLEEIARVLDKPTTFHIKIDTGMHRQGIVPEQLGSALALVKKNKNIIITGICSHLADADGDNPTFTQKQISVWNALCKKVKSELPSVTFTHLSATSGTRFNNKIDANVIRLGIGLYGIDPHSRLDLKPVLEMKSVISGTKTIGEGGKVGYNATFEAAGPMRLATIPLGYNDGVDRRLSNKGFVKIGQHFSPIVGRVSMNITTIDITRIPEAQLNTSVTLISDNPSDPTCLSNIAATCGTIPYEIMIHIPQQMRRRVV